MENSERIYLDFNGTTPIDTEVQHHMLPHLTTFFGNPSSAHIQGKEARVALRLARQRVADLINCSSEEIIFTSGGTESNNMAIKVFFKFYQNSGSCFPKRRKRKTHNYFQN